MTCELTCKLALLDDVLLLLTNPCALLLTAELDVLHR